LPDDTVSAGMRLPRMSQHACIRCFKFGPGRLDLLGDVHAAEPGAILQRVLEEYYRPADSVEIPSEILAAWSCLMGRC